ncbi:hypothetical protein PMAYCL1PPCAC_33207, partial [Pristionchus mayeri]
RLISQLISMSGINLSLDEIIAKTRAAKKGRGSDSTFKSDGIKRVGGGGGARRNGGGGGSRTGGSFTKSVPGGKWRHDKFAENESGGRGGSSPRGGVLATAVNANKKVRVNLSNLAPSVTTADLEELFAPYEVDSAACHFDETGTPLGTGDVVLKRSQAMKALNDFKGVSVDGNRLVLAIVDAGVGGGSIFDRLQISKVSGGGIQKRSRDAPTGRRTGGGGRGGDRPRSAGGAGGRHPLDRTDDGEAAPRGGRGGARGGRGGRGKITEEDLDAELNAYMKKPAMEH